MTAANPVSLPLAEYRPQHFLLAVEAGVATVTLNRPERKNPLTFESYRELADLFAALAKDEEVKAVVIAGAGGNFSSGGDVFEIIGPLVEMDTKGLTRFTRMTGELVKAMRACPQPIVAAVDGICAGAGAIVAMASDLRLGTARAKSSVVMHRAWASASASIASSTDMAHSMASMRFVMALAKLGPAAISRASAWASASTDSGAHRRLKKPQAAPSSPDRKRPV